MTCSSSPERWSPETEILLFSAARRDHLERTIEPALAAGKVVIKEESDEPEMIETAPEVEAIEEETAVVEDEAAAEPEEEKEA